MNDNSFDLQVLALYFQNRINIKYIRLKYSEKVPKVSQPCREQKELLYPYKIVSIEITRKKSPIEELLLWAVQKTVKIDC